MKLVQTTIEKTFIVQHKGVEYSVDYTNSDGQTLALCNRDCWEVYADGEEFSAYVFSNSTPKEKRQAKTREKIIEKLMQFCCRHFDDFENELKQDGQIMR